MMKLATAAIALMMLTVIDASITPGRLVVWGTDAFAKEGPPSGNFIALAAGGALQTLAIRADGTMYLSGGPTDLLAPIPPDLAALQVTAVGTGRNHGLAIRGDGSIVSWGLDSARAGAPARGEFVAVTGGGLFSLALDTKGKVVMWGGSALNADYDAVVGVGAPAGIKFTAIAARGRYSVAVSADGDIYGWGIVTFTSNADVVEGFNAAWTPDGHGHYMAPRDPDNPYTAVAAGLDLIVGLRADGTVVTWEASGRTPAGPTGVAFSQIAAGRFAVGIDRSGHLHAWGTAAPTTAAPAGKYSAVGAATGHVNAILIPGTTPPVITIRTVNPGVIGPANHRMATAAVSFRADADGSPVAMSRLSASLRSSQPDTGFASGNTTGDTNGADGYSTAVALPASAIVQNADGSFTATFQIRAEVSDELIGTRIYTLSIVAANGATPPLVSAPTAVPIAVQRD